MRASNSEGHITSKRIEVTVREDRVDVSKADGRQGVVDRLKHGLNLSPDEDIRVVGSYPLLGKLVLQMPSDSADALVRAVELGEFREGGILGAYVCPSAPEREEDLGFERKPMVQWFRPIELVRAGVKAVLSALFGSYADRREVQALQAAADTERQRESEDSSELAAGPASISGGIEAGEADFRADDLEEVIAREVCDYSDREELWLDYVADLGDGWDSTYTVARLLAEKQLNVLNDGGSVETKRGQILVMGGDQVYPTATREEYNNRLVGPYRAALPCVIGEEAPTLFAVPGNHDWYDGLTSFTRLFCQQRWIGGWRTEQIRSYFAVRLPHDWWLWGIDVQLESDIDLPQFNYFKRLARHIKPGSKIILCTAEPSWVYAEQKGARAYQNLEYFERKIIRAFDLELVVGLAGDLHTYAHYEERFDSSEASNADRSNSRKHRFVSGGGGAYLYPSHQLPEQLELNSSSEEQPVDGSSTREIYDRKDVFPEENRSRKRSLGVLALPFKNWRFAGVLGLFYLLFAWVTQSATKIPLLEGEAGSSFIEHLEELSFLTLEGIGGMFTNFWIVLRHSPATAIIVLLLFGGLVGFADKKGWKQWALGAAHTVGHVILALFLMWSFSELNLGIWNLPVDAPEQVTLFAAEMLVVGSLLGGILFGVYMLLSNIFLTVDREMESGDEGKQKEGEGNRLKGVHANEVFSAQSIPDYKNFLRLQIRSNGDLVIYPVGIEKVCRVWHFNSNADDGSSWFDPKGGTIEERAELIEEPIVISSS